MNTQPANARPSHDLVGEEDAAAMIFGLKDIISITLEDVDIVSGRDEVLGYITIVKPAAGDSCLLYPFEK